MEQKISGFLNTEIWQLDESQFTVIKRIILKTVQLVLLSSQGFSRDLCPLRASALTLYTLLSIVPVIAMLFGIAKGFGFEKILKQRLIEQIPHQDTLVQQIIQFAGQYPGRSHRRHRCDCVVLVCYEGDRQYRRVV